MSALAFLKANPVLIPLVAVVGAGIGGGLVFGSHYLKNNQDVVIKRKSNSTPWNNVRQDQNSKLFSWNKDFWHGRAGLPDPRRSLRADYEATPGDHHAAKAYIQRARQQASKEGMTEA